ncbi:MAG: PfkB family carbohydrate kinase [Pseudomonadota bacterium]
MSGRIVQVQGAVVDLVYRVAAIPPSGGEAKVTDFAMSPGGGFNALVAAKRLGANIAYGGGLGQGPFASLVETALAAEGIDTVDTPRLDDDQGTCVVLIEPSGERTFVAKEGAEGRRPPSDYSAITRSHFDWALLSGYSLYYEGLRAALVDWLARGDLPKIIFDPSPAVAWVHDDLRELALRKAHWISANRAEAESLTGLVDPEDQAAALAKDRPKDGGALVRLGAEGAVLAAGGEITPISPHKVTPVDTNGAGDAHLGAFAARLAEGASPTEAARYANLAAALAITQEGPATAPSRAAIDAHLKTTEFT